MSGRFVKKEPRRAAPKTGTQQVEAAMRRAGYRKDKGKWIHKDAKQTKKAMAASGQKQQGQATTVNVLAVPVIVAVLCILILAL